MAYNLDAILASTHAKIEKIFQDNLGNQNAMFVKFAEKDGKQIVTGGKELTYPIIVENGNAGSFYGDDVLNVNRPAGLLALTFSWRQFYSTVVIDGLEEVMNSGPEAAADLVAGRMKQSEITTANKFETMLFGDGTGNSSKDWNGLQNLVPDDATTGTIGGLSRVTYTTLRNYTYTTAVTAFNTSGAGRTGMITTYVNIVKGNRKPNFIVTTPAIWALYQYSLQANERFIMDGDKKLANAGFPNLLFMGDIPVTMSTQCPASHLYMIRIAKSGTDGGIFLVVSKDANFKMGKFLEPVDQDKRIAKIITAGNLCTDAPYLQGVMTNITG